MPEPAAFRPPYNTSITGDPRASGILHLPEALERVSRLSSLLNVVTPVPDDWAACQDPSGLDYTHWQKVNESGLNPSTIKAAAIFTERDTVRLRMMLQGSSAVAPALILPGFDRHGKRNDYDVARTIPPHIRYDGSEAKYLNATGLPCRAYFPPLSIVLEAVNAPGKTLMITEGILKALAATQAGVPCIGLMGVWNWVVGGTEPRQLIPDLADIDWQGRLVLIVFDYDRQRNPHVNRAAAELARVLTECGADVRILHLPPGPNGPNGRPMKQGLDDFVVRLARQGGSQSRGEEAFRRWVQEQIAEVPLRGLEEYRAEMLTARPAAQVEEATLLDLNDQIRQAQNMPVLAREPRDILLDRSPTGVGKSYADFAVVQKMEDPVMAKSILNLSRPRTATLVPTHAHCQEAIDAAATLGLRLVAYPRLDATTCLRHDEAAAVMSRGLSFQLALCPDCQYPTG